MALVITASIVVRNPANANALRQELATLYEKYQSAFVITETPSATVLPRPSDLKGSDQLPGWIQNPERALLLKAAVRTESTFLKLDVLDLRAILAYRYERFYQLMHQNGTRPAQLRGGRLLQELAEDLPGIRATAGAHPDMRLFEVTIEWLSEQMHDTPEAIGHLLWVRYATVLPSGRK